VTPNSGQRVWWLCKDGHEWQASIAHRNRGSGCPFCSGHKASNLNNFAVKYPHAAAFWHPSKNADIPEPHQLTPRSSQIAWWKCPNGHEWQASVSNVATGSGCPICISLAVLRPGIAAEWAFDKNVLTPETIGAGSGKKVWWRCAKGHEWQSKVVQRTRQESSCPQCSGRVASHANNFAALYPDEAKYWHPTKNGDLQPRGVTPNSSQRVWWLCRKGHETEATVASRAKGFGCNKCSRKTSAPEIRIFTELNSVFEDVRLGERLLKAEADIYIPQLLVAVEYDGAYFHRDSQEKDLRKGKKFATIGVKLIRVRCRPLGQLSIDDVLVDDDDLTKHDMNALVSVMLCTEKLNPVVKESMQRYMEHHEFRNETMYREYIGYFPDPLPLRSLEHLHPELVPEWDEEANAPLLPRNFTPSSGYVASWVCAKGHKWNTKINYRTAGTACPTCREYDRMHGNYRSVLICDLGHRWVAKYSDGKLLNSCSTCANKKAHSGYNVQTEFPEIAAQWHPIKNGLLKPTDLAPRSSRSVWWQCPEGHAWKVTVAARTKQNTGCAVCSGRRASAVSNLETEQPALAAQWHPTRNGDLTPSMFVVGSAKRVWWLCTAGHEWDATIKKRLSSPTCPFCAGTRADSTTCLATLYPDLMKEWHPIKNVELDPTSLLPGSGKKAWWQCSNGHEWQSVIRQRAMLGTGCRKCADGHRSLAQSMDGG
jgi:very-short-patch-repair endonuclease